MRAKDVMTTPVITVRTGTRLKDVAGLLVRHAISAVPIVEIRRELRVLLEDEILMLGRFEVEVRDGVVTLSGRPDRAERRLAELLARSVPGVIAVTFVER